MSDCSAMLVGIILLLAATQYFRSADSGAGQTYGGYQCMDDCSGHRGGFKWAREKQITDALECTGSNSLSFEEGCNVYLEDPDRDANADDDGNQLAR